VRVDDLFHVIDRVLPFGEHGSERQIARRVAHHAHPARVRGGDQRVVGLRGEVAALAAVHLDHVVAERALFFDQLLRLLGRVDARFRRRRAGCDDAGPEQRAGVDAGAEA
jgi:hypothetical protein